MEKKAAVARLYDDISSVCFNLMGITRSPKVALVEKPEEISLELFIKVIYNYFFINKQLIVDEISFEYDSKKYILNEKNIIDMFIKIGGYQQ